MSGHDYNYVHFDMEGEMPVFDAFPDQRPHVGEQAPSFPLEDLETGEAVEMKELWREGLTIMEWGSFT